MPDSISKNVLVTAGPARLPGTLTLPLGTQGVVVFAHGSGSSRHSPRNRFVAQSLNARGLGTLLFDLLTPDEEAVDIHACCLASFRIDAGPQFATSNIKDHPSDNVW